MNLLVTGNLGFIGPEMTRQAKAHGHAVIGLDTGYFRDCVLAGTPETPPDRQLWRDIRDVRAEDLAGADAIVHLAGLSNDALGELDPRLTADINHVATLRLARLAKSSGVERFVFASSCAVYGSADGSVPLAEGTPHNPVSAYANSKSKAEGGLSDMAGQSFSPVMLRFGTAHGLGPRPRFDLVLNNLCGWAHSAGVIRVTSDGTPWRPLIHIEDIGQAILAALAAPRADIHNQAFNVGRGDANYQVREIAAAVNAVFPAASLEITGETGGDPRSYRVDFSRTLRTLPSFAPRWTLEMGIEEVARFLKANGLSGEAFDSPRFIRLKQLRHAIDEGALRSDLRVAAFGRP